MSELALFREAVQALGGEMRKEYCKPQHLSTGTTMGCNSDSIGILPYEGEHGAGFLTTCCFCDHAYEHPRILAVIGA